MGCDVFGSKEHEDRLREYATELYEVVRCQMVVDGNKLPGLTFRFCGNPDVE